MWAYNSNSLIPLRHCWLSRSFWTHSSVPRRQWRVGRLIMLKEMPCSHDVAPFVITDDMKSFYYRGLLCEQGERLPSWYVPYAQDRFKATLDYFRIAYDENWVSLLCIKTIFAVDEKFSSTANISKNNLLKGNYQENVQLQMEKSGRFRIFYDTFGTIYFA